GNLPAGGPGKIFYMSRPEALAAARRGDGPPPGAALHRYDLEKRKDETVQASVMNYELTPDGRKMLYQSGPTTWQIGSASPNPMAALLGAAGGGRGAGGGAGGPPRQGGPETLDVGGGEVAVWAPGGGEQEL